MGDPGDNWGGIGGEKEESLGNTYGEHLGHFSIKGTLRTLSLRK